MDCPFNGNIFVCVWESVHCTDYTIPQYSTKKNWVFCSKAVPPLDILQDQIQLIVKMSMYNFYFLAYSITIFIFERKKSYHLNILMIFDF